VESDVLSLEGKSGFFDFVEQFVFLSDACALGVFTKKFF
jgi:hypothetical protein